MRALRQSIANHPHSATGPLGCFVCANHRRVERHGGSVCANGRYHAPLCPCSECRREDAMSNTHLTTPPCRLCGGNAGSLNERGEHNFCAELARLGLPTPNLGMRCRACNGRGCNPRSAVGPINPSQKAMDAWAPKCRACGGTGVEPGTHKGNFGKLMTCNKIVEGSGERLYACTRRAGHDGECNRGRRI